MIIRRKVLSLLCVFLAAIMTLSSCGVRNAHVISEGESENAETSNIGTTNEAPSSTDDAGQTDENGVIIEIQRPVAGAPEKDPTSSAPNIEPSESEESDGSQTGEENDLPYADEAGVFVPYAVPLSIEDQMLVEKIAARFNVHEELVFGVMWAESRYDRGAVGRNNRYLGVMQISISNLSILEKYFGVTDLMDFEQNVTAGCYYLGHYANMYNHNMNIMLLYYHGGYKYANPMIEQGIFEDRYVREVLAEMNRIIDARKQTAAEMGVKIKGWLYEY